MTLKKKDASDSTIPKRKIAKQVTKGTWKDKYNFYNQTGLPDSAIDKLAEMLTNWAEDDTPKLFFGEFLVKHKIARKSMADYLKRSEKLRTAKDYAMQVISAYREGKAYEHNFYSTFRHTQGLYSPQWKAQEQYFSKLKALSNENSVTKEDMESAVQMVLRASNSKKEVKK